MTRFLLTLIFIALAATSLSACNTVQGFGKDLQSAGETIQGV